MVRDTRVSEHLCDGKVHIYDTCCSTQLFFPVLAHANRNQQAHVHHLLDANAMKYACCNLNYKIRSYSMDALAQGTSQLNPSTV